MACRWSGWTFAPLVVLASLSCSSSSSGPADAGGNGTYTPIEAAAFNGFCNWSSAEAVAEGDASDGVHNLGLGPLRVYWNHAPPHGSTAFPQGTLILKSSEEADPTQHTIFAMAKVGGGYNASGAVNWEWFSFKQNADCTVTLLWQAAPPSTESYAGLPIGDCNGCHTEPEAKANDYVWDTALQLSNF